MKFNIFTLLIFCLSWSMQLNAQNTPADMAKIQSSRIQEWIKANPQVEFFSANDFLSRDLSEQNKIAALPTRFLFEGASVSWSDIQTYELNSRREGPVSLPNLMAEQQQIQQWLQNNADVKIISMNEFQALSSQERAYINNLGKKIIYDSRLKMEDIHAYEGATNSYPNTGDQ